MNALIDFLDNSTESVRRETNSFNEKLKIELFKGPPLICNKFNRQNSTRSKIENKYISLFVLGNDLIKRII